MERRGLRRFMRQGGCATAHQAVALARGHRSRCAAGEALSRSRRACDVNPLATVPDRSISSRADPEHPPSADAPDGQAPDRRLRRRVWHVRYRHPELERPVGRDSAVTGTKTFGSRGADREAGSPASPAPVHAPGRARARRWCRPRWRCQPPRCGPRRHAREHHLRDGFSRHERRALCVASDAPAETRPSTV
jgi:hypothetical protein